MKFDRPGSLFSPPINTAQNSYGAPAQTRKDSTPALSLYRNHERSLQSPHRYLEGSGWPYTPSPIGLESDLSPESRYRFDRQPRKPSNSWSPAVSGRLPMDQEYSPNLVDGIEELQPADIINQALNPARKSEEAVGKSPKDYDSTETTSPPEVRKAMGLSLTVTPREARTYPLSTDTRICMTLFGEVVTYDLATLDSDPRYIIELLRVTKSELLNYVLVGGAYRKSGLHHSAKAVMASMIQESTAQNMTAFQLKPAYLFMSACEGDLARMAKAEGKADSASEFYEAQTKWLQKIYGNPESLRHDKDGKENTAPLAQHTPVTPKSPKKPLQATPVSANTKGAHCSLEREIQSLRDRNAHQARLLAQVRSAKRKVEDDYFQERGLRRKYEEQVGQLENERDTARKLEKYALDQVKREVVMRRALEKKASVTEAVVVKESEDVDLGLGML